MSKKNIQNKLFDIRSKFQDFKKSLKFTPKLSPFLHGNVDEEKRVNEFMPKNSMENPTYFYNILQIFITNEPLIVPKL